MLFLETRNILIFLFLAVLVFSALILIGDYRELRAQISNVKITTLLLLIIFSFGNYIVRFVKWQFFLNFLKIHVKLSDSFLIFISGLSMAFTPAKIGDTIKSYLLHKMQSVNVRITLPIIFSERLTDLFGLTFLSLIGLSSLFVNLNFLIIILILLVVGMLLVRNERVFYFLVKFISKVKFTKKYLGDVSLFHTSLKKLLSIKPMAVSIVLSAISWALEGIALYFLINSLGFDVPLLSIIFIYSFSSIAGALAFIPGGLGVTEGSLLSLLAFIGLPLSVASLSTIIIRLTTLWFGVTIGLLGLFFISGKIKTRNLSSNH